MVAAVGEAAAREAESNKDSNHAEENDDTNDNACDGAAARRGLASHKVTGNEIGRAGAGALIEGVVWAVDRYTPAHVVARVCRTAVGAAGVCKEERGRQQEGRGRSTKTTQKKEEEQNECNKKKTDVYLQTLQPEEQARPRSASSFSSTSKENPPVRAAV